MSLKAKLIHDALTEHANKVLRNVNAYLPGNRIAEERIAIIDKFLDVESPVSVPSKVDTYKESIRQVSEALMYLMECSLSGERTPAHKIEQMNEAFRKRCEDRLIAFRNAVRAEVLDEVAKGSGAADEMLRKATEGTK